MGILKHMSASKEGESMEPVNKLVKKQLPDNCQQSVRLGRLRILLIGV